MKYKDLVHHIKIRNQPLEYDPQKKDRLFKKHGIKLKAIAKELLLQGHLTAKGQVLLEFIFNKLLNIKSSNQYETFNRRRD
jgi:hypothetical protein